MHTDEQIRATLMRRDRVNEVRAMAEAEAARSSYEMAARTSPMRMGMRR